MFACRAVNSRAVNSRDQQSWAQQAEENPDQADAISPPTLSQQKLCGSGNLLPDDPIVIFPHQPADGARSEAVMATLADDLPNRRHLNNLRRAETSRSCSGDSGRSEQTGN